MKEKRIEIACVALMIAIVGIIIWGMVRGEEETTQAYSDGITQVDLDSIYLADSGVEVDFSEVLVGQQQETRKLIISTHEATVSTQLSSSLIKQLDVDFMKKTQTVTYTGEGYFVVDLDSLTSGSIVEDTENKIITIKIDHPYLQLIDIDPDKIVVGEVQESLLARGDIKLTVQEYNEIEKSLISQMETKLNTAENGQIADQTALRMVQEVYEPIVKAIDARYSVEVEFR